MVEDFKRDGEWARSTKIAGVMHCTRSYSMWNALKYRCKVGGQHQLRFPSYIGCKIAGGFEDYQFFVDWHREQVGYGIDGYALDKDIIDKQSKIYSPETCALVPRELNSFYTPHTAVRDLPQGVYYIEQTGKYKAALSIGNKLKYVGTYGTIDAAWEAFKEAKEAEAARWVQRLVAGEFIVDPRVIVALRKFEMKRKQNE